jgi:polyphosphate kinase
VDVSSAGQWPQSDLSCVRRLGREEGWLRFCERGLELAEDTMVPLLERVRFLAIFARNLDEFFSLGSGGLTARLAAVPLAAPVARRSPRRVPRQEVFEVAGELMLRHAVCFRQAVLPALARQGIEILGWDELSGAEQHSLHRLFRDRIHPVMTPQLVDPAHPFPYISGLSLNLAVVVADPQMPRDMFARLEVPPLLPRFVEVSPHRFIALEDVIAWHLVELFEGMKIREHHVFRVTRRQRLEIDEHVTGELMPGLQREPLDQLKGPAIRLEAESSISEGVLQRLATELGIGEYAAYLLPGPLDLAALHAIADLNLPNSNIRPPLRRR